MSKKGNVLVITYWSYSDALIQTYTLPYVRMIKKNIGEHQLYLVTLERKKQTKEQTKGSLRNEGIHWIPLSYSAFGIIALLKFAFFIPFLWWQVLYKGIKTIHTWCTPAGGIGYILSILTGRKLILDSYEPHAEPMVEAGQWKRDSLAFKLLWWLEKKQSRRTDTVIACVEKMQEYAKEKYDATFKHFYWKPAAVDLNLFHPSKRKNPELMSKFGLEGKTVFVYAGKFGGSYLTIEVFHLFKAAEDHYGDKFQALLLSNHPKEEIKEWSINADFDYSKIIQVFVPHKEVPDYMGLGDVGLVPFVPVPSKRYGSPIKTGEYLSMGMPIIITKDISDDSDLIQNENIGVLLNEFNQLGFQHAVQQFEKLSSDVAYRARSHAQGMRGFGRAENVYQEIYGA